MSKRLTGRSGGSGVREVRVRKNSADRIGGVKYSKKSNCYSNQIMFLGRLRTNETQTAQSQNTYERWARGQRCRAESRSRIPWRYHSAFAVSEKVTSPLESTVPVKRFQLLLCSGVGLIFQSCQIH